MGIIKHKTSKATQRRAHPTRVQHNGRPKVLTAEGWKRMMLGSGRTQAKKEPL